MEKTKLPLEKKSPAIEKNENLKKAKQNTKPNAKEVTSSSLKTNKAPTNDPHQDQQSTSHFDFLLSLKTLEESLIKSFTKMAEAMTSEQRKEFDILKKEIFSALDQHRHAVHAHTEYLKHRAVAADTKNKN